MTNENERSQLQLAFENNLKFLNQEKLPESFFAGLFTKSDTITPHIVGKTDLTEGRVILADPLAYLGSKFQTILEQTVPAGSYPVEVSVLDSPIAGLRIAAARLRISDKKTAEHRIAMPQGTSEGDLGKNGVFTFFGVDSGLACFADKAAEEAYVAFAKEWVKDPENENLYDDYFEPMFRESYEKLPQLQREGGDFICWSIPDTEHTLIMFSSGLGDGAYSGYWGFDEKGDITELVVPFMDPELFV